MVRKIAALAGAGALLLSVAGPAFGWSLFSTDVAIVKNKAVSVADTGGNSQDNIAMVEKACWSSAGVSGGYDDPKIETGNANSTAGALVVANVEKGCPLCGGALFDKDVAIVKNSAASGAYTGGNSQDNIASVKKAVGSSAWVGVGGDDPVIDTGNANSTARAWTIVNVDWY